MGFLAGLCKEVAELRAALARAEAGAAKAKAAAQRALLAEARRPWWRRLVG